MNRTAHGGTITVVIDLKSFQLLEVFLGSTSHMMKERGSSGRKVEAKDGYQQRRLL